MFIHHHAHLITALTQFLDAYGLKHGLGAFSMNAFKQAPTTYEGIVGQFLCFGFDVWPSSCEEDTRQARAALLPCGNQEGRTEDRELLAADRQAL